MAREVGRQAGSRCGVHAPLFEIRSFFQRVRESVWGGRHGVGGGGPALWPFSRTLAFGAVPVNTMDHYVFIGTSSISVSPAAVGVLGNQHSKALSAPLCQLAGRIRRDVA